MHPYIYAEKKKVMRFEILLFSIHSLFPLHDLPN